MNIVVAIFCWTCLLFFCLSPAIYVFSDYVIMQINRKKYPEYFILYDDAMSISREISSRTDNSLENIRFHVDLIMDGMMKGECTEEYFKEYLNKCAEEYLDFVRWRNEREAVMHSKLKEADLWAKEHGFKRGIIH